MKKVTARAAFERFRAIRYKKQLVYFDWDAFKAGWDAAMKASRSKVKGGG